MFAGGALAISLLSAHLNKDSLPVRPPEPTISRPVRPVYLSQARANYANDMSQQSNPATLHDTFSQSQPPPVQLSPVAEADQAYRQMQWKEASRVLNDAIERKGLSNPELCRAYTLLGAMEYQTGRLQAARTYFVKAYQYDPEAVPSPELFPPQVIEFYNSVRKRGVR
jgi:tetratricopeptide (TPR) repeat protein